MQSTSNGVYYKIMNIKEEAKKLLIANRRVTDGHQYTVPSPHSYPYQWLWDSCFHAIILAKLEPKAAKKELRALVSKQFDDGMIPHMIYWRPGDVHRYEWGKEGTSAITQPPLLAYAVWEIYKADGDLEFLKEIYPSLTKFYHYLIGKRDPRDHHLVGIINPDESGEDNSPRFDELLGVPPQVTVEEHLKKRLELIELNKTCNFDAELCMKEHFWVKDVPFNSILVENLRVLEHIASRLGDEKEEHVCKSHIELVGTAMRDHMFYKGIFWSTEGEDYKRIPVATWAHFAPLFADLYSQDEAGVLVEEYLRSKKRFMAPYGIRTVSKEEPSYNPEGYWRGSAWIAVHWFIYKGLKRYGFEEEARMIREKSIALIEHEGFREYFNPETGEGLGAENFTWGTLVLDMMES